jgi:hypothetical protein
VKLAIFLVVAVVHFALSVLGVLFTLPVAFDVRGGLDPEPGKAALVFISSLLLAPLAWISPLVPGDLGLGYGEIAIVSVLSGLAALALHAAWRRLRLR